MGFIWGSEWAYFRIAWAYGLMFHEVIQVGEGAYKLGAYFLIFGILRLLKIKSYSESMKVDLRG